MGTAFPKGHLANAQWRTCMPLGSDSIQISAHFFSPPCLLLDGEAAPAGFATLEVSEGLFRGQAWPPRAQLGVAAFWAWATLTHRVRPLSPLSNGSRNPALPPGRGSFTRPPVGLPLNALPAAWADTSGSHACSQDYPAALISQVRSKPARPVPVGHVTGHGSPIPHRISFQSKYSFSKSFTMKDRGESRDHRHEQRHPRFSSFPHLRSQWEVEGAQVTLRGGCEDQEDTEGAPSQTEGTGLQSPPHSLSWLCKCAHVCVCKGLSEE